MRIVQRNSLPEGFWQRVLKAEHRLLVLDYDGTVAPFHVQRERARPVPGVVPALQALSEDPGFTVALLSGRPVGELFDLLVADHLEPLERVQLFGEHGWECCCGDEIWVHPVPARAAELLARAERSVRQMGFGKLLERKRASIVLHTRALSRKDSRWIECACEALWSELEGIDALRLDEIDGGLELRAAGRNKVTTLRELVAASPAVTFVLYVGGDTTDEDVFRTLQGLGVGLRVASGPCFTAADGTLASCREVARWLSHLSKVLHGGDQPPRESA